MDLFVVHMLERFSVQTEMLERNRADWELAVNELPNHIAENARSRKNQLLEAYYGSFQIETTATFPGDAEMQPVFKISTPNVYSKSSARVRKKETVTSVQAICNKHSAKRCCNPIPPMNMTNDADMLNGTVDRMIEENHPSSLISTPAQAAHRFERVDVVPNPRHILETCGAESRNVKEVSPMTGTPKILPAASPLRRCIV